VDISPEAIRTIIKECAGTQGNAETSPASETY
jgi:hypothetical protein